MVKCKACTYCRCDTASTSEVLDLGTYGPAVCIYLSLKSSAPIAVLLQYHGTAQKNDLSCSIHDSSTGVKEG